MTFLTRAIVAFAARVFSKTTLERVIDPILCDIELEHRAQVEAGRVWRSRWVAVSGCWALVKAIALQMLDTTGVGLVDEAARRTMLVASVALTAIAVALTLPPLLSTPLFTQYPSLAVYLLPQAIPLGIPIALSIGIVWAGSFTDRRAMLRRVIVLGTVGAVISLATMEWLMPAADDGFRVTFTRLTGRTIVGVSQGVPLHMRVALSFAALALPAIAAATAAAIRRRKLKRTA